MEILPFFGDIGSILIWIAFIYQNVITWYTNKVDLSQAEYFIIFLFILIKNG